MARPKKEKGLKRSHQIMLRLTDTEYEVISIVRKTLLSRWQSMRENSLPESSHGSLMKLWQICRN